MNTNFKKGDLVIYSDEREDFMGSIWIYERDTKGPNISVFTLLVRNDHLKYLNYKINKEYTSIKNNLIKLENSDLKILKLLYGV